METPRNNLQWFMLLLIWDEENFMFSILETEKKSFYEIIETMEIMR